jgi:hypothetical protein
MHERVLPMLSVGQTTVRELPPAWRALAELLRTNGAEQAARATEARADELEAALRLQDDSIITLAQAAAASGYSADHLSREVREGRLRNVGRKGAPRIRRADLPRKPAARLAAHRPALYDPVADARSLLAGRLQE